MSLKSTGYKGVRWEKRIKRYRAEVSVNDRVVHLGCFEDVHEAGAAASNFRLEMQIPRKLIERRCNRARSINVKTLMAERTPEERKAIAYKGWETRRKKVAEALEIG